MIRPGAMTTVDAVERDLDRCLRELRAVAEHNLPARASLEYRIGRLRQRREALGR